MPGTQVPGEEPGEAGQLGGEEAWEGSRGRDEPRGPGPDFPVPAAQRPRRDPDSQGLQ